MADQPRPFDPGPIALPSDRAWLDPALVGRQLYYKTTDVPIDPAGVTTIATPNPYRWGLLILLAPSSGLGARFLPFPDVTNAAGQQLDNETIYWYNVFTNGPIVCGAWYAAGGAGSIARVVETIRRSGG